MSASIILVSQHERRDHINLGPMTDSVMSSDGSKTWLYLDNLDFAGLDKNIIFNLLSELISYQYLPKTYEDLYSVFSKVNKIYAMRMVNIDLGLKEYPYSQGAGSVLDKFCEWADLNEKHNCVVWDMSKLLRSEIKVKQRVLFNIETGIYALNTGSNNVSVSISGSGNTVSM